MKRAVFAILVAAALVAPASAQQQQAAYEQVRLTPQVRPERYTMTVTPDAQNLTLRGEVTIALNVLEQQQEIVVNALDLEFDRVTLDGAAATSVTYQESDQTMHMRFGRRPVATGRHNLQIAYHGQIYRQAQGLFAQEYDADGRTERMLVTQFQAADARRFVPSFDEPAFRSVFDVTIVAPQNRGVISNMPEVSSENIAGGLKRVRFAPSPSMPIYLLFAGVGDFERISQTVAGVEVSIVTKRGDVEMGRFALQAAADVIPYFNDYFGTPYPLPKLDIIAAPGGGGFAAMENWGAILFFEQFLLVDPDTTSEAARQFIYTTVAHEIAHMWFGNLVTMEWWDDIWLNEGFATWMENKVTDQFHPEWNVWMQAQGAHQGAMLLDARTSSHPIIVPIRDVEDANQAFDQITYQKGDAVIRMFENVAGAENFRAGVRAYMQAHAYGNATSTDLWNAVEGASNVPLRRIADDFTRQQGVPLISIESACSGNRRTLTARQGEFTALPVTRQPLLWRTPVAMASVGASETASAVTGESRTVELALDRCGTFVVNPDQVGYYRVRYDRASFDRLARDFARVAPGDQLGVLYDARALGRAGVIPAQDFFALARRTPRNADPLVWNIIAGELATQNGLYEQNDPRLARFRTFARGLLNPVFARVGWEKRTGEADNDSILRATLIGVLAALRDPRVEAEALRRYRANDIDGQVRGVVLASVAANATPEVFEDMLARARNSTDTLEKQTYYAALSAVRDPVLARRVLDIAFDEDVHAALAGTMINGVSGNDQQMAYDFAESHDEQLRARLDPFALRSFRPGLAVGTNDPALARRVRAYIDALPPTGRRTPEALYANINERLQTRERRTNEVSAWLAGGRAR